MVHCAAVRTAMFWAFQWQTITTKKPTITKFKDSIISYFPLFETEIIANIHFMNHTIEVIAH